jgi:hypothetical protein
MMTSPDAVQQEEHDVPDVISELRAAKQRCEQDQIEGQQPDHPEIE